MIPSFTEIVSQVRNQAGVPNWISDFECSVELLGDWCIPAGTLPHTKNRNPFGPLLGSSRATAIENTKSVRWKVGRLSDGVRDLAGSPSPGFEINGTVECHIDISDSPPLLENALVRLGFEHDDFLRLEPPCYSHHFTLKAHASSHADNKLSILRNAVRRAGLRAAALVQAESKIECFIEEEVYTPKFHRHYSGDPFAPGNGVRLPGYLMDFRVQPLPRTPREELDFGVSLSTCKMADVHIKLAEESQEFAELLDEAGFYSIVSEAGNTIYTGQYLTVGVAQRVFEELDRFIDNFGGAKSLILEVCTGFWRKRDLIGEDSYSWALVSPLLVRD